MKQRMAFAPSHSSTRRSKTTLPLNNSRAEKLHHILEKQNQQCRHNLIKAYVTKHMIGECKQLISSPAAKKVVDETIDRIVADSRFLIKVRSFFSFLFTIMVWATHVKILLCLFFLLGQAPDSAKESP